jgi:thiamine-phosphate pyrophosphorylase
VNLYCITDSLDVAERAARNGATMIQVRAKQFSARALFDLVTAILRVSRDARVLVNSRLDIALAAHAHGVHLPADSMAPNRLRSITPPDFLIGVSCHSIDDLHRAEQEGADFAVFGPVFPTPSHPTAAPLGLDKFASSVRDLQMPVYALGGVTRANAASCIAAGAAGIAGISFFEDPPTC